MAENTKPGKVMVAVDGSPASYNALKYAVYLASKFGAQLVAVYVVEEEKVGYWRFIDEHFKKELMDKSRQVMAEASKLAEERGLKLQTVLLEGNQPYAQLVGFAEEHPDITTVVMGDHGMGLTDRHLLGSTTERMIRLVAKKGLPLAVTVVPFVDPDSPACGLHASPLCE